MISEWFTARELAEFELPTLPTTKFGIIKKASVSEWKARPRAARGGGVEYHISTLPQVAQMALVEKQIGTRHIPAMSNDSAHYMHQEKEVLSYSAEQRRNAKIVIVKLFEKFRQSSSLNIIDAERPFIKFYEGEREAKSGDIVPLWVFDIHPSFSVQSLRRWRKLRHTDDAFLALAGKYGNRKGSGIIERAEDGKLKTFIIAVMCKQPHLTGGHVRDQCRAQFGETVLISDGKGNSYHKPLPNVRTFERFMLEWRNENAAIHLKLTNPDAYKNKYMVSIGKADESVQRMNQLWEIDASPSDVLCKDGRYSIYGIIDVWSRRVMYMVSKTAKTEGALLLLRRAIMEWGVPEMVRTDQGQDFKSHRFVNALISLRIEQDICDPFSGDQKGFVERHFRTLQHDLMPHLPGYGGHSVSDRKEIQSRKAFAERLGENGDNAIMVEGLDHEGLQIWIDRWANEKFQHRPHGGLNGVTPFAKAASWIEPIKRIENIRALDLLLAPVAGQDGFRTVSKKGIRLDSGHFWSAELIPFMGKRIMVRVNPQDMGVIYCYDELNKFVCEARCLGREGVNPVVAAAEAKKAQKVYEQTHIAPLRKEMNKITPTKMADNYLGLAFKDNGHLTALPKKSEAYETPDLYEAGRATMNPQDRAAGDVIAAHALFEKKFMEQTIANPTPQSDEERWWSRVQNIETRIAAGELVPDIDLQWLESRKSAPWYISRCAFEQLKKDHELTV